jgi:hypothetical protein
MTKLAAETSTLRPAGESKSGLNDDQASSLLKKGDLIQRMLDVRANPQRTDIARPARLGGNLRDAAIDIVGPNTGVTRPALP